MSFSDCVSRITELDALMRGVDPNWATSGYSLPANDAMVIGSPFAGLMQTYNASASASASAAAMMSPADRSSLGISFTSPLPGARLTQAFGPTNETLEPPATVGGVTYAHYHNGIDLAAARGTSVLAAAAGTVTFAGRASDGAVIVKIRHDNGYTSLYGHLDPELQVAVGDRVSAAQVIGKVGLTGVTTGPHLHFGLYSPGGSAINPSVSLTAGHMPDPDTLLAPDPANAHWLTNVSGPAALAKFDAVASHIPYAAEIRSAAVAYGVDPLLLAALASTESGFRPRAVSKCGAQGLTQLMPKLARSLGITDSFDPQQNLNGGAMYLARQLKAFGRVDLALAAYQAGPGTVGRLGAVPSGSAHYVRTILNQWKFYQGGAS
jgi:murein DD-endopeptidase MepM/ murein hydrolase activator NlpD